MKSALATPLANQAGSLSVLLFPVASLASQQFPCACALLRRHMLSTLQHKFKPGLDFRHVLKNYDEWR